MEHRPVTEQPRLVPIEVAEQGVKGVRHLRRVGPLEADLKAIGLDRPDAAG